jgi:hypothetical protein
MAGDNKTFVADDGISTAATPVTPAGGEMKKKKADLDKSVDPTPGKVAAVTPGQGGTPKPVPTAEEVETDGEVETVEEVVVESSVASIFEGLDLSEEFKNKMTVVFEAAVNEEVANKTQTIREELEERLESELSEAVESKMEEIVENVDKYLDYVVSEWMEENTLAVEAGIKVEMAESLMNGLKDLFTEHNMEVEEETFDVVAGLEEKIAELEEGANGLVSENIELQRAISAMKAEKVFEEMTEGLSENQKERFRVLSEKLDVEDLEDYGNNLQVIKESFFSDKAVAKTEIAEEEEIILEEQEVQKPTSDYSSINALVEALNARKKNN